MQKIQLVLIVFLGLIAGLSLTSPGFANQFKDWEIGCDNAHHCLAIGFPGVFPTESYLMIERDAGPAAQPVITLSLSGPDNGPPPGTIRLAIDGRPILGFAKLVNEAKGDGRARFTLSRSDTPDNLAALLAALRTGQRLDVLPVGDGAPDEISLAGAVAALLKMDDVQGRIDTETALIRRGTKPAASVPPAPALPVVAEIVPKPGLKTAPDLAHHLRLLLKSHPGRSACAETDDPTAPGRDQAIPLSESLTLIGIACDLGAYQGPTEFYLVRDQDIAQAKPVLFHYPFMQVPEDNSLIGAEVDPATASISFFTKARGLGDCGATGRFAWTGSQFLLTAYNQLDICHGDINDWPSLWRSQPRVTLPPAP